MRQIGFVMVGVLLTSCALFGKTKEQEAQEIAREALSQREQERQEEEKQLLAAVQKAQDPDCGKEERERAHKQSYEICSKVHGARADDLCMPYVPGESEASFQRRKERHALKLREDMNPTPEVLTGLLVTGRDGTRGERLVKTFPKGEKSAWAQQDAAYCMYFAAALEEGSASREELLRAVGFDEDQAGACIRLAALTDKVLKLAIGKSYAEKWGRSLPDDIQSGVDLASLHAVFLGGLDPGAPPLGGSPRYQILADLAVRNVDDKMTRCMIATGGMVDQQLSSVEQLNVWSQGLIANGVGKCFLQTNEAIRAHLSEP